MKAIRVHETGGPEQMRTEDIPVPDCGSTDVLVEIDAAGINFIDVYHRIGLYRMAVPFTPGQEGAGVVRKIGSAVKGVAVGDRVGWCSAPGAYAEYALVPADAAVPLPDAVSSIQAAAVLLQGMTAHYLATSTFPLEPGHTCVIHAAAGGVGLLLCQIAKRRGATVIGTAGTHEKAALAHDAGADTMIVYTETDFEVEVKRITGDRGVDVVFDSVGRSTFEGSLRSLARRGTLVLFGQSSGTVPPLDPLRLNQQGSVFLTRPSLRDYTATRAELTERASAVLGWVADGTLQVRVGGEYPLENAADAHRDLESRRSTGKLLLIP